MNTTLVQQALVVQFNFNGHHKWASCPLCLQVGPQKEKVLEHLNKVHTMPGQEYHLVEAHDVHAGLNTFWLAVCQFFPGKVQQTTPAQDRKVFAAMKKAQVLSKSIEKRVERAMKKGKTK